MRGWWTTLAALTALVMTQAAAAAEVRGWRNDGTNAYSGAMSTVAPETATVWSTPLGAWGNGSPIVIGGKICATAEPTTLACVEQATGRLLWKGTNHVVDTFPPEAQAPIRAQLDAAAKAEVTLKETSRAFSATQRDARRAPDDAALQAKLSQLGADMDKLKATIDGVSWYTTPPDKEIIGYASATPVSDGVRVYALFGNGVVSAWTLDGKRVWTRWLGPHRGAVRGYDLGTAASPQLAGGRLIVPWDSLLGLDPATGATMWDAGRYQDYGTPGVATVGGIAVVLTPDGNLLRATDGLVLQRAIADIWYVGPVVQGQDVYYIGTNKSAHSKTGNGKATAVRLEPGGLGVRATVKWAVELPSTDAIYSTPVIGNGKIYNVTSAAELIVLDQATGRTLVQQDLAATLGESVYSSPVLVGEDLLLIGSGGNLALGRVGADFQIKSVGRTPTLRSTPVWGGGRLWLRTYEALTCLSTG
jgi:outer membrane protein assembly factor BamB